MMSKKSLGLWPPDEDNLFIFDSIFTTLVALVPGGKLLLVLVKLVAVTVGSVFSKNVRANMYMREEFK